MCVYECGYYNVIIDTDMLFIFINKLILQILSVKTWFRCFKGRVGILSYAGQPHRTMRIFSLIALT